MKKIIALLTLVLLSAGLWLALCSYSTPTAQTSIAIDYAKAPVTEARQGIAHVRVPTTDTPKPASDTSPSQIANSDGATQKDVCPVAIAEKQGLITTTYVALADSLLSKIGRSRKLMSLSLRPDAWASINTIMVEYLRREKPLKRQRSTKIMAICRQRIAAGQTEDYPTISPSDPRCDELQAAARKLLKPRAADEIVQEMGGKIVRISPRDDPELFETMRQYGTLWEDIAVQLEVLLARR